MDKAKMRNFKPFVDKIRSAGQTVNIILNHFDPDSIACGFGLKHILRRLGIPNSRIRILCLGEPGEEQNEMIIDRYSLSTHMLRLEEIWPKLGDNDVFAFVDSSNPNDKRLGSAVGKIKPVIVIDHHSNPIPEQTDDNFIWVEQLGSCSAMIAGLMQECDCCSFSKDSGDDVFVPVLLALGIHADTHGMTTHITNDDVYEYAEMFKLCDAHDLKSLIQVPESPAFVAAEDYARNHLVRNGLRLVACAGYISSKKSVHVARIINKLLNWRGVSLAVVFALTDDKKVIFSVRSTDITLQSALNHILRREFGDAAGVKRSDDGSMLEGGGQICVGFNVIDPAVREKFLEVLTAFMEGIFMSEELS